MTKLKYRRYGKGESVVLIHGWGIHSVIWDVVAQRLSNSYQVTLFDLPGYGDNEFIKADSIREICQKIFSAIPEGSIIIGWSMGGLIAIWLAAYYPYLVKKLILVASNPCFVQKEDWFGISVNVLKKFRKTVDEDYCDAIDRFLLLQVALKDPNKRKQIKKFRNSISVKSSGYKDNLINGINILFGSDMTRELAQIYKPIFWFLGKEDQIVPVRVAQYLKQLIPNAKGEIIEGAGHVLFISHQDLFLEKISGFIDA